METTIIAWIVDIVLVLFVAFFVWRAARKGLIRTLVEVIGFIAAVAISFSLASFVADKVYETAIRPGIVETVNNSISENGSQALGEAVNDVWEQIPSFITGLASVNGLDKQSLVDSMQSAVSNGSANVGAIVTDNIIKPLITSLMSFVLAIILFSVLMFLVRFVAKKIDKISHIPLLSTANAVLGGVLGFIKGVLAIFVLVMLISLLMPMFQNKMWIFTPELIDNSHLFKVLYTLSPFANI